MEADPQQLAPSVVSVVVVHQPGDWFEETLAALAAQDYPNLRCLFLVTGASDDDEAATISDWIRGHLPSAFVRRASGNPGFGAIANEVLRLVEGDNGFFLLCHDDIAPEPDAITTMVTELYRSNAGMVGPKLVEWDEPRRLQHVGLGLDRFGETDPIVEPGEIDQEQHDAVRDVFVLPSACLLVRADLFRALDGFDPAIAFHGEDVELCWRAHLTGARVVVAPDARVRHLERLAERRPELNHRQLRARHRMRAVATLTGASRLAGRSLELVVLTLVELVVGIFSGRAGEAVASVRALGGLIPRTGALIGRRRTISAYRSVPEREVLGLQVRGSARLASYLRGRETTTYVGAGTTVRRWRETSFGPLLAWFLVLAAIVIGSRTLIDRGVPSVGEFLPLPDHAGDLVTAYRSAFDPSSLGVTAAVPTGWLTLAGASTLVLYRMGLALTAAVIGLYVLGAVGAWRLATLFPSNRARIATMVVYVGTPLVPGMLGSGHFSGLVFYAALPWMVHLLRRASGIDTADPALAPMDLVDGIGPTSRRERVRHTALLSLVLAVAVAFVPIVLALWLLVGVVLAITTLLARASLETAGWFAGCTAVSVVVATVLNAPWVGTWTWGRLVAAPLAGPGGTSLVDLASLSLGDQTFGVLAIALYVPLVVAIALTRAWRLTWAVRAAGLVLVFGAIALLADRGDLFVDVPEAGLLLVPVALGLAIGGGALAGGFGEDVLGRGFGWRQPAALVATAAIVVGIMPAAASISDGSWDAPRVTLPSLLAARLPSDAPAGGYRVLFVGDPRVLPVPGIEYRDGIAYAVTNDGSLEFTDRWPAAETNGDARVVDALDRIAEGSTLRAGQLLAPLGVRYIVVPTTRADRSGSRGAVSVPSGLIEALDDQLDIGEVMGPPSIELYENRAWIPVAAQLSGPTAEASHLTSDEALVRADLGTDTPLFPGLSSTETNVDTIDSGVVQLAVPYDVHWKLRVEGAEIPARVGFGVSTTYDVATGGTAELSYAEPASRTAWIVIQLLLWLLVLVAASRATLPFASRRTGLELDEPVIDLDETAEPNDLTAHTGPIVLGEPR